MKDFIARSSAPGEQGVRSLTSFYAPQVVSYGSKPTPRAALMQEKERQASQFDSWPSRTYSIRQDALDVRCDAAASTCVVKGVLDWDYVTRHGSSAFSYTVLVRGDQAMIVQEGGSTLERQDR